MKFDTGNIAQGNLNGINYATKKAPIPGAINGYAQLPEGHPWRDQDLQSDYELVDIHGGITYGPDENGWVGFDTLHAGDHWPGMGRRFEGDREWTAEMVADEARDLARQIADAEEVKNND